MPGPGRRVRRHAVPHGQDLDAADDNERCRSTSSMPLLAETLLSPTFAAIVNDIAPEPLRGRYNGLSTLAWTTGFLIGPAIAGTTLGAHHGTALLLGLITACAAAALGAARLARHLPPEANHVQPPAAPSPAPATPRGERPKATGRPAGREAPAAHVPGTVATP